MKRGLTISAVSKSVLLLLMTLFFSSCANLKNFHNNKARGEAGIVRIPQYKNDAIDSKEKGTFLWSYYDASRRGA